MLTIGLMWAAAGISTVLVAYLTCRRFGPRTYELGELLAVFVIIALWPIWWVYAVYFYVKESFNFFYRYENISKRQR